MVLSGKKINVHYGIVYGNKYVTKGIDTTMLPFHSLIIDPAGTQQASSPPFPSRPFPSLPVPSPCRQFQGTLSRLPSLGGTCGCTEMGSDKRLRGRLISPGWKAAGTGQLQDRPVGRRAFQGWRRALAGRGDDRQMNSTEAVGAGVKCVDGGPTTRVLLQIVKPLTAGRGTWRAVDATPGEGSRGLLPLLRSTEVGSWSSGTDPAPPMDGTESQRHGLAPCPGTNSAPFPSRTRARG